MRFIILLLISMNVFAVDFLNEQSIHNSFLYSFDTEGNQIIQNTTSDWFHINNKNNMILTQDFGVGYTHSWYINDDYFRQYNYNGSALSLLSNYKFGDFSLIGSAGIGQMNNRSSPYFLGDMNFNYQYNKNTLFSFETYGDLVNSTNAMNAGIALTGYSFTVDYFNDYGGVAANVGNVFFSNDNIRTMGNLKLYLDVYDGVNIYFRTKQYGDQNPGNGLYWSPDMYSRYGLGIGFRQRYEDLFIVSGIVEGGVYNAYNEWGPATAWRINIENIPKNTNWIGNFTIGSDLNGSNNYQYFFMMANIKYNF